MQTVTDGTLSVDAPGKGNMSVYVCEADGFTGLDTEFELSTNTLSFDGNGAEGNMESISSSYSGYVTLPQCTFIPPADKVFKAWSINGVEYDAGTSVLIKSDSTAVPVWKDIVYYDLYLGNQQVSNVNCADILGDGTAEYEVQNNTLILNGYKGEEITSSGSINILMTEDSENTISGGDYGINAESGSVDIKGNASLVINAKDTAVHASDVNVSGSNVTLSGRQKAMAASASVEISGGVLNALGEESFALDSDVIKLTDAVVTAVSYKGAALSSVPDCSGFTKAYDTTASQNTDGVGAVEYNGSDNGSYKYFKVNPYYTASFSSDSANGTMDSIKTVSGIITLPECSFIRDDDKLFACWWDGTKYYKAGAKLAIEADTEFKAAWNSEDDETQVVENVIYLRNDAGWSTVNAYCWKTGGGNMASWPGTRMENIEGTNIWKLTVSQEEYPNIIFNDGSSQTGDLLIPTDGNNIYSNSTGSWSTYGEGIRPEDTSGVNIITFNGGMGYMEELLNTSGIYTLPTNLFLHPEYRGDFTGWSVNGTQYQPGDSITISEDTVVSALWECSPSTVGNVNGDKKITAVDALSVLLYPDDVSPEVADVNGDQIVNEMDAIAILSVASGEKAYFV
ncbi:MAG: starch-binding protein [Lachnospiraceae bacterium]